MSGQWNAIWGVLETGAIWSPRADESGPQGIGLLEPGADVWRTVASWSGLGPVITPDESFVVVREDSAVSAFPLKGPLLEIPLRPGLPSGAFVDDFYAGGVLMSDVDYSNDPTTGQIWWAALSASSFGPPVRLVDVPFADRLSLQPLPR